MYRSHPILENDYNKLRFLQHSDRVDDESRIAAGEILIPDIDGLKKVQFALHAQTSPWERYGEAKVANNLAAAYICLDRIYEAREATFEAEAIFREMLRSSNPYPVTHTLVGLCISHYHLNLIHLEHGVEPRQIEEFLKYPLSLLDVNEDLYKNPPEMDQTPSDDLNRFLFVRSAISAVVDTLPI